MVTQSQKETQKIDLSGEVFTIVRLSLSAALLIAAIVLRAGFPLYLAAGLIAGLDVLIHTVEAIMHGKLFDENFLMVIAATAAFIIGEYAEAAALMLLFRLGEMLEERAENSSRRAVERLMELRPDTVELIVEETVRIIPAQDADVADIIMLRPGVRAGLDGIVVSGYSTIDTSAITGESLPREISEGDEILAGSVNLTGALKVKVTVPLEKSAVSRILEMVEGASERKTHTERLITRFARIYTPVVLILALLTAFVPPLLFSMQLNDWVYRALVVLIASCPCAIVISVPLAYFSAIGGATGRGILFRGSLSMDAMCNPALAVFDKTGTLTTGRFKVSEIIPESMNREELLHFAAAVEKYSAHPLARAVAEAASDMPEAKNVRDIPGKGTEGIVGDKLIACGSASFMQETGIQTPAIDTDMAVVFVSVDNRYAGMITLSDTLKPVGGALEKLRSLGTEKLFILSGDREEAVRSVSDRLGMDGYFAECRPEDKIARLKELLESKTGPLMYIGDGVNDTPALTLADVGISMGGLGAESAIESSDIVIMDDDLAKLPEAVEYSRRTRNIIRQNICMALGFKVLVIALGTAGIAPIWLAVAADVGVTLVAILNSTRAGRRKNENTDY